MYKFSAYYVLFVLLHLSVYGQNHLPEISLNHIYAVLDSVTYSHLFDSLFIEQKIGNTRVDSVTTTDDSWSGKYLIGKNSYFEFFSNKGFQGATEGDCGLGFITLKSGDIWKIKNHWKETATDSIQTDTATNVSNKKMQQWYYSINLFSNDSIEPFAIWVMENTPEELMSVGFSDSEIKNKINWQQYAEKRNKKAFTKSFGYIQSVSLSLTVKEFEYMQKSCTGFGLRRQNNIFFNDQVKIICSIEVNPSPRLKQIEIELVEMFEERSIKVSDHLTIQIKGSKAIWMFQ